MRKLEHVFDRVGFGLKGPDVVCVSVRLFSVHADRKERVLLLLILLTMSGTTKIW